MVIVEELVLQFILWEIALLILIIIILTGKYAHEGWEAMHIEVHLSCACYQVLILLHGIIAIQIHMGMGILEQLYKVSAVLPQIEI